MPTPDGACVDLGPFLGTCGAPVGIGGLGRTGQGQSLQGVVDVALLRDRATESLGRLQVDRDWGLLNIRGGLGSGAVSADLVSCLSEGVQAFQPFDELFEYDVPPA